MVCVVVICTLIGECRQVGLCPVDFASSSGRHLQNLALEAAELHERPVIVAGGKEHVHVPGADRDVGQHVGGIGGQHGHGALGDLLLPGDAVDDKDGGVIVHVVLDLVQVMLHPDNARRPAGADHLPGTELCGRPQSGFDVAEHLADSKGRASTDDLLCKKFAGPLLHAKGVAEGCGDGLNAGRDRVADVGQSNASAVHHGGSLQSLLSGGHAAAPQLSRQPEPRRQAEAYLLVVTCGEAQVLEQGANQPDGRTGVGAGRTLGPAADHVLERKVQVDELTVASASFPDLSAGLDSRLQQRHNLSVAVGQDIAEEALGRLGGGVGGGLGGSLEVRSTVDGLQDPKVVLKLTNEIPPHPRVVLRLAPNGPVKALEPCPCDAVVAEHTPVDAVVPVGA
mmetsp:Transcript_13402/g.38049  ORF Transcript_13402/g.38049 Transcript_13402/m.38049 type:complete len:395 (+) Transcript_13402:1303-2487(+)